MDKRWIYILVILIIGVSCLYLIVESSTTIGKATVSVNSFLVTAPDSFNIFDDDKYYTDLINRNTREKLFIKDLGKKKDIINSDMSERVEKLYEDGNYANIKNITPYDDDIPTVYYEDSNSTLNQMSYVVKYNHTFFIRASHFHDNATMQKDVKFVIDSIIPNYKQKQD